MKKSLESLQLDYVDLYLVHSPIGLQDTGDVWPRGPDGKLLLDKSTNIVEVWQVIKCEKILWKIGARLRYSNQDKNAILKIFIPSLFLRTFYQAWK